MSPRITFSFSELAPLLGYRTEATLRNNLPRLYAAGFPRRLPHCKAWSAAAVLHWIDDTGGAPPVTTDARAGGLNPLEQALAEGAR